MSIFSFRSLSTLSVVLIGVSAVSAQEAGVDPIVPGTEVATAVVGEIPTFQPVVATCAPHPDNVCIAPTQAYLTNLAAQNVSGAASSQALADLVIALVPLAPSGDQCGVVDSEVPAAILLIANQTPDPAQAAQFRSIATTLQDCVNFETAAIAPVASPN